MASRLLNKRLSHIHNEHPGISTGFELATTNLRNTNTIQKPQQRFPDVQHAYPLCISRLFLNSPTRKLQRRNLINNTQPNDEFRFAHNLNPSHKSQFPFHSSIFRISFPELPPLLLTVAHTRLLLFSNWPFVVIVHHAKLQRNTHPSALLEKKNQILSWDWKRQRDRLERRRKRERPVVIQK